MKRFNLHKFIILFFVLIIATSSLQAQNTDTYAQYEKDIKKQLKLKTIVWDPNNGDGVFLAQHKKTQKWGMYQLIEPDSRPKRLVLMRYDSLGFFAFNGAFTIAKKNGKYGTVEANWSGSGGAELLHCQYEMLRYVRENGVEMVASQQNGKWGYLHYKTGDTLIPFAHEKFSDLPKPSRKFYKQPMVEYPEELKALLSQPDTVTQIDLSYLKLEHLPEAIGKCVNAKVANLEGNKFNELPDAFFRLKKLKKLYLGGNPKLMRIDKRLAQLPALETLIIGRITRYGVPEAYSVATMDFDDGLVEMKNLKFLVISAYFPDNRMPEFLNYLPNLEYLEINSRSSKSLQYDLSQLTCKSTLKKISLHTVDNLKNWDAHIEDFPNLEKFTMTIKDMKDGLESIMKIPKLSDIFVKSLTKVEGTTYYEVDHVLDYSLNSGIMTKEQRKEAIEKWHKHITASEKQE